MLRKLRYQKNKARAKLLHRKWFQENKEKRSRYGKDWRLKNFGRWSANRRRYYREVVKPAQTEEWKAKMREYQRLWHIRNKAKARANWQRRYALKKAAVVGDVNVIKKWIASWSNKRIVKCHWCGSRFSPKKANIDHILAISLGGKHEVGNLCISCRPCNRSKHGKELSLWNRDLLEPVLF